MGKYLDKNFPKADSIVLEAYRRGIPIFVPAFSDCSAGFGLVFHQVSRHAGKASLMFPLIQLLTSVNSRRSRSRAE